MPRYYTITTPIYYVNSIPHIGTALTTFASDVTSRYQKLRGQKTFFMTGTDENATKVFETAKKLGKDPQKYVDDIAEEWKNIWKGLCIEYDDFIRTTEPRHKKAAEEFFKILKEKGYIYEGIYEGWYDVSSETFYKESELVDGKSPEGNPVQKIQEKNWFFKLSAFEKPLLDHIQKNPDFIIPEARKNEVVSFIKQGLRDVSMSRTNPGWGIPIPGETDRVFYVWFEALINYLTASDWPNGNWDEKWPAEVQWMGKDILTRFHATLWPAMLIGAELPLPKHLVGHGWMLMGGEKISKSKGNVIAPLDLAKHLIDVSGCSHELAIDAIRHYMGSTMPYENDTVFTNEDFEKRYNSDLANDLGNALNRTLAMCHKFVDGKIPSSPIEREAEYAVQKAKKEFENAMDRFRIDHAVHAYMELVRFLNKYIDQRAPWALAKNSDPALGAVIRSMLFVLRSVEGLLRAVQPATGDAISDQLKLEPLHDWSKIGEPEIVPEGHALGEPKPLFPRIDIQKKTMNKTETSKPTDEIQENDFLDIADFAKIRLRVALVQHAEPVENSDKLLRLEVSLGDEKRQVVAGIRSSYEPDDIIGKKVVMVTNLKPAKIRGQMSYGMLLVSADSEGKLAIVTPEKEMPEGATVR